MSPTENSNPSGNSPSSLSERVRSLRLTDSTEAARSRWWWLPWAICGVLFCAMAMFALEALSPIDDDLIKQLAEQRGLNFGKGESQSTKAGLPGSNQPQGEVVLESKGYVVPISLIQVSPKIGGTVMKLNIQEGKFVEKGFVLAMLEDVEYKSDYLHSLHSMRAAQSRIDELGKYRAEEIDQAKAELDDAVAQYDQMAAKYTRTVSLKQRNAVAPEEFESAESNFRQMKARVERLKLAHKLLVEGPRDAKIAASTSERRSAKADLDKSKWRFKNTRVEAPITGVILSKKTEEGNIVNPSAFSNGLSASLCEMADLHKLEVDLSIAERDLSKLYKDQDCLVRAEAFPNRIYSGTVSRIMPMADRSKSSVPVRVRINFPAVDLKGKELPMDAQGEYLRPEMGAIVTFLNRKTAAK